MRPSFDSPVVRLRPEPDAPAAIPGRPRGSRRPHADAKVAAVRRLIEQTALTYGEIAAKTGVGRASICRWTRDGQWQRPVFAPRATDTVPRARASAQLKARTLHARLAALAERMIRELEDSARVDLEKLAEALELMKMAKLAARPRRPRGHRRQSPADFRRRAARRDEGPARKRRPGRARAGGGAGGFHREPRAAARADVQARPSACADAGEGVTPYGLLGSLAT